MLNKILAACMAGVAVFALALSGCKKAGDESTAVYNADAITEDNALQEADKVLQEIDGL